MRTELNAETYPVGHYMPPTQELGVEQLVQIDTPSARKLRNALLSVASSATCEAEGGGSVSDVQESSDYLQQLYPILLAGSVLLAGLFCFLYITKPVVVKAASTLEPAQSEVLDEQQLTDRLMPWPDAEPVLQAEDFLMPLDSSIDGGEERPGFEKTNLKMQQVFLIEGEGFDKEKLVVEHDVAYSSRLLRWDAEKVRKARLLKQEMVRHLNDVRIVRENGDYLMNEWESLDRKSVV